MCSFWCLTNSPLLFFLMAAFQSDIPVITGLLAWGSHGSDCSQGDDNAPAKGRDPARLNTSTSAVQRPLRRY